MSRILALLCVFAIIIGAFASDPECDACEAYMTEVRRVLPDRATPDQCITAYKQACQIYGPASGPCVSMFDDEEIVEIYKTYNCPVLEDKKVTIGQLCHCPPPKDHSECEICTMITNYTEDRLQPQDSDDKCISTMLHFADTLEDPFEAQGIRVAIKQNEEMYRNYVCPTYRQHIPAEQVCEDPCSEDDNSSFYEKVSSNTSTFNRLGASLYQKKRVAGPPNQHDECVKILRYAEDHMNAQSTDDECVKALKDACHTESNPAIVGACVEAINQNMQAALQFVCPALRQGVDVNTFCPN